MINSLALPDEISACTQHHFAPLAPGERIYVCFTLPLPSCNHTLRLVLSDPALSASRHDAEARIIN